MIRNVRMCCDSQQTGIATRIIINAVRIQPMMKVTQLNCKHNCICLNNTIKFHIGCVAYNLSQCSLQKI
jgi:hypothetical protein